MRGREERGSKRLQKPLLLNCHHGTSTWSPCCTQSLWWTTESSPVYASAKDKETEGQTMEFIDARRWCLEKNTGRKAMGNHLPNYPELN